METVRTTVSGMSRELLEGIVGVCQRVQRLVACYEEARDPVELDCLVYHVGRLHHILLELNTCSSEVLEAVGRSLTLLEELNRSHTCSIRDECGYTPGVILENCSGRPRLDIEVEQLVYLLHQGFKCPKIDVLSVSLRTEE